MRNETNLIVHRYQGDLNKILIILCVACYKGANEPLKSNDIVKSSRIHAVNSIINHANTKFHHPNKYVLINLEGRYV